MFVTTKLRLLRQMISIKKIYIFYEYETWSKDNKTDKIFIFIELLTFLITTNVKMSSPIIYPGLFFIATNKNLILLPTFRETNHLTFLSKIRD